MYQTEDLYLASAIQEMGIKPRGVWKDGSRSTFEFEDTPELQRVITDFISGNLTLEAQGYSERIRSAKSAVKNAPGRVRT